VLPVLDRLGEAVLDPDVVPIDAVVEGDSELLTLALILDVVLPLPDSLGLILTLLDVEAHSV
jgi:hypothetical protein